MPSNMFHFMLVVLNLKKEITMGKKWPTQAFLECSGSTLASHKGRIPCTSSRPISSAIDFCLASFLDDINAGGRFTLPTSQEQTDHPQQPPTSPALGTSNPMAKDSDSPTFYLSALCSQGSTSPSQNLKASREHRTTSARSSSPRDPEKLGITSSDKNGLQSYSDTTAYWIWILRSMTCQARCPEAVYPGNGDVLICPMYCMSQNAGAAKDPQQPSKLEPSLPSSDMKLNRPANSQMETSNPQKT